MRDRLLLPADLPEAEARVLTSPWVAELAPGAPRKVVSVPEWPVNVRA